ncbi:GlsB/YeaQ/YmgE family stress response membrane protein [Roseimaritima sediminicola]|uniref:GlsB/YeaQ/YmgE family stress response membrane protein n=1 Tax=Roseimaritima sediminicola TaxID=2662066 RepID=UPI0012985545|nr:GlsB/YeaQ/YmgE family stress response membrane protein [Roseimaritima sediminicola]
MFWLLGWIVFGFLIGLIARGLYPGRQSMGLVATTLLGIAGSLLGGFVGYLIAPNGSMLQGAGWIGSLLGAVALIAIAQRTGRRRIEQP